MKCFLNNFKVFSAQENQESQSETKQIDSLPLHPESFHLTKKKRELMEQYILQKRGVYPPDETFLALDYSWIDGKSELSKLTDSEINQLFEEESKKSKTGDIEMKIS